MGDRGSEVNILYAGPGLSGCRSSLAIVGKHLDPALEYASRATHDRLLAGASSTRHSYRHPDLGVVDVSVRHDFRSSYWVPSLVEARDPAFLLPYWKETLRFCSTTTGIVFVADSRSARRDANVVALGQTMALLLDCHRDVVRVPLVFQLNFRDCADALPSSELRGLLRHSPCRYVDSVAITGEGVVDAFNAIIEMTARIGRS